MALSKPSNLFLQLISTYFEHLYISPVKTKAITSCIIASLGNLLSQKISGAQRINSDSLLAYALFGFFFGGSVPHYFYMYIHPFVKGPIQFLMVERFLYTPCVQALTLYMLTIFEGNTHNDACKKTKNLYWPILIANLKYLTLLQYINLKYVPPVFRVLVVNLINFFWFVYLSQQRSKQTKPKRRIK
ncbi:peroxisomal membrane protein 2 [Ptiloglossa arizonensis]|uniref:peroxisomal membrane protein 2 n=1 Tax=Ptiloglossa arizonensis TaxID=3350558 RepID=UPI003F9FD219